VTKTSIDVARQYHPNKSDAWLSIWLQRLQHYIDHRGDMAGAPEFQEPGVVPTVVDNDNTGASE
jgi:hypothetical protein